MVGLASESLKTLTPHLRIDPNLFYNPKELPETAELVQNKAEALTSLHSNVCLVRALVDVIRQLGEKTGHDQAGLSLEARCDVIYKLACWLSMTHLNEEWQLDKEFRTMVESVLDCLWKLPLPTSQDPAHQPTPKAGSLLARTILANQIKPLFTRDASFSRNINPLTGRKSELKYAHLFGTISTGFDGEQVWQIEGIGFWNALCDILARLHQDDSFQEIWPLIIPPIITLLDESTPRYRLRGIQLSNGLLEHAPPSLICRTGIDSLLQKTFSTTFSLLNMSQTLALLNTGFEANLKLIQVQWSASQQTAQNQADRYHRLHRLIEETVFNVLAFGKLEKGYNDEIDDYAISRLADMTHVLGLAAGRYLRVIVPYLCETLLNTTLQKPSWMIVVKINKLIVLLFDTCGELVMKWQSRLVVVFATCWLEWHSAPKGPRTSVRVDQSELSQRMKMLQDSVVLTLMRIVQGTDVVDKPSSARANLTDMMDRMNETDPLLKPIFGPILTS